MDRIQFWNNISWLDRNLLKHQNKSLANCLNWPIEQIKVLESGQAPTLNQLSILHHYFGISFQELLEVDLSKMAVEHWLAHFMELESERDRVQQFVRGAQ